MEGSHCKMMSFSLSSTIPCSYLVKIQTIQFLSSKFLTQLFLFCIGNIAFGHCTDIVKLGWYLHLGQYYPEQIEITVTVVLVTKSHDQYSTFIISNMSTSICLFIYNTIRNRLQVSVEFCASSRKFLKIVKIVKIDCEYFKFVEGFFFLTNIYSF